MNCVRWMSALLIALVAQTGCGKSRTSGGEGESVASETGGAESLTAESEPNDDLAGAGALEVDRGISGVVEGDDVDVYRLPRLENGVELRVRVATGEPDIRAFDGNLSTPLRATSTSEGRFVLPPGAGRVEVRGAAGYSLMVVEAPEGAQCGFGAEAERPGIAELRVDGLPANATGCLSRNDRRDTIELAPAEMPQALGVEVTAPSDAAIVAKVIDSSRPNRALWERTIAAGTSARLPNLGTAGFVGTPRLVVERPEQGEQTSYTISVSQVSSEGAELEPNDTIREAIRMERPAIISGSISDSADVDRYTLAGGNQHIRVAVQADWPAHLHWDLVSASNGGSGPQAGEGDICSVVLADGMQLHMEVRAPEGHEGGEYTLHVTALDSDNVEVEPNDEMASAYPPRIVEDGAILIGERALSNVNGFMSSSADVDHFAFTVPAAEADGEHVAQVDVRLSVRGAADLELQLSERGGARVAAANQNGIREGEQISAELPPGMYVIQVRHHAGETCGDGYRLAVGVGELRPLNPQDQGRRQLLRQLERRPNQVQRPQLTPRPPPPISAGEGTRRQLPRRIVLPGSE